MSTILRCPQVQYYMVQLYPDRTRVLNFSTKFSISYKYSCITVLDLVPSSLSGERYRYLNLAMYW